jgi:Glycosyl transferase family 2
MILLISGLAAVLAATACLLLLTQRTRRQQDAATNAALRVILSSYRKASDDVAVKHQRMRVTDEEWLACVKAEVKTRAAVGTRMPAPLQRRRDRPGGAVYRGLRETSDTAAITESALHAFTSTYPDLKLQPLVIVIAAYNEAHNIGSVLDEIPGQVADVPVSLLVIDDGSTDATTEVAERHGALVCTLWTNRGHGVALRLGYRIAREGGAQYIATVDADGQWDPAALESMIRLVDADQADVVIGSRQLGGTKDTDLVRNLGVKVFSRLISKLTRTTLTDTSCGLRLMRAWITSAVTQTQPQYQTAEFLIATILRGYRVAEVPTVMRLRLSGSSRKGNRFAFGLRYARVVVSTYRRERRLTGQDQAGQPAPSDQAVQTRGHCR